MMVRSIGDLTKNKRRLGDQRDSTDWGGIK